MKSKIKNILYIALILAPLVVVLSPFAIHNYQQNDQQSAQILSYNNHHESLMQDYVAFEQVGHLA
jgi:hypothetical protein